jgi:hypothetical protein
MNNHIPTFNQFLNESVEEPILNEDGLTTTLVLLQAAMVGGQLAMLANKVDFHPIDDLKDWWNTHKRDKAVQSILKKLKDDQDVIEFLQLPKSKQEGQWKKLIAPKLNADEIKYINSISRDRVKSGKLIINEERVYGMFNDNQGKPSKLSQEILDICLKALPKYVIDNIESVEAAGYSTSELLSPPTVSNKGQSRGSNEYTTIILIFKNPMGKSKTTELMVGLRKRTSGPGTGYLAVKPTANGHYVLPEHSAAIEFYDAAPERLADLYKSTLEKLMK